MLTADYTRLGLCPGDLVLDLGCGFGRHAYEALRRGASVIAYDLGIEELHEVKSIAGVMYDSGQVSFFDTETNSVVLETTNGNATQLPFADDSFDRIVASEVMEHIADDRAAITELTRVLRPGGTIAITVPSLLPEKICWSLSEEYYAPKAKGGHLRIYARKQILSLLRNAGMTPTEYHRVHALHSPYWWLRCAVGPQRSIEDNWGTALYHRLLSWDIEKSPLITRWTERLLNPVLGKSLVVYATKPSKDFANATT